ncbi:MAG TPA: BBP7 family outer membrane beta-barrel protein [Gemmataceae bacterium]|jgi:hypothetical protein|nr:BBP7 family outer membrane beta-barrel protein [Gemmataceae bacterium]
MGNGFLGSLIVGFAWAAMACAEPPDESLPTPKPLFSTSPVNPQMPGADGTLPPQPGPDGLYPLNGDAAWAGGDFSDRFWFGAEYLIWRIKHADIPPLVTTGPLSSLGIIGQPGTEILFGGFGFDNGGFSGARFTAGMWLDCEKCTGIEASVFFLGERSNNFLFDSAIRQLLARPFISLNNMQETSELITFPNLSKGEVRIAAPTRLWGPEVNCLHKLCCGCCYQLDYLIGLRYLQLDEALDITESIRVNSDPNRFPPEFSAFKYLAGANIFVNDRFATHNSFYGGQIGADLGASHGHWQLQLRGKLGLGWTHEVIDINGGQLIVFPDGRRQGFRGGLLALPTNIGHFTQDRFAVVPEADVNVGYRVSNCLCIYMGYTFLYWSRVVRPGDQIDRVIDTTQIPNFGQSTVPTGFARPTVPFKEKDFWAQGLNFGLEFTW